MPYEEKKFDTRKFVSMVRAELAAAGRADVTIERRWIVIDTPGYAFLLHVPVGTELTVPVSPSDASVIEMKENGYAAQAAEFAKALINLRSGEKALVKYAHDVRRELNKAIADARAKGDDILLHRLGFMPAMVGPLTDTDWKEASYYVVAEAHISTLSFLLKQEISSLPIDSPEDAAEELDSFLESHRECQSKLTEMEAKGADLIVDHVTLDLLAASGIDVEETLRRVYKAERVSWAFEFLGEAGLTEVISICLTTCEGEVSTFVELPNGYWNGRELWLTEHENADFSHLVGKSLGDLCPYPVFRSQPIVAFENRGSPHFKFDLSDVSLFDSDTGKLWREERLAA